MAEENGMDLLPKFQGEKFQHLRPSERCSANYQWRRSSVYAVQSPKGLDDNIDELVYLLFFSNIAYDLHELPGREVGLEFFDDTIKQRDFEIEIANDHGESISAETVRNSLSNSLRPTCDDSDFRYSNTSRLSGLLRHLQKEQVVGPLTVDLGMKQGDKMWIFAN
jgi:hypothetical protein